MTDRQSDLPHNRFDVAISLLSQDEPLARELVDALTIHVRGQVFLYSRQQNEIAQAGQLVDLFTRVFKQDARVAVVLHRSGWGVSGYTAVEQDALRGRLLREGARSVLIVSLDGTYPSAWYPEDHFRLSSAQFSVSQMAAIIAARVHEAGGTIGTEPPTARAARLRAERAEHERLSSELRHQGPQVLEAEANRLYEALEALAKEVSQPDDVMTHDQRGRGCRLNYRWGSLVLQWHREYQNSMDGTELALSILDAPTEFGGTRISEPRILISAKFDLAHPAEDTWLWRLRTQPLGGLPPACSTQELANWCVNELLERMHGDPPQHGATPRRPRSGWIDSWRY